MLILLEREDDGFVCQVPDCPGCISEGDTLKDAIINIIDALDVWTRAAKVPFPMPLAIQEATRNETIRNSI